VQTLKKEFADYMRDYKHPRLRLYGPWDHPVYCKMLIREGKHRCVKFGEGWKEICAKSKYTAGDVLLFKCKDAYWARGIYVAKTGSNRKHG
jgi:hypothetical protein